MRISGIRIGTGWCRRGCLIFNVSQRPRRQATNRWQIRFGQVAFGVPIALGLLWSFESTSGAYSLQFAIVSVLIWMVYSFGALGALFAFVELGFAKELNRYSVFLLIYPIVCGLIFFYRPARPLLISWVPDYVHFALYSPTYVRAVQSLPDGSEPKMKFWLWTQTSIRFGGGDDSATCLVYDASHQLSLKKSRRSDTWKRQAAAASCSDRSNCCYDNVYDPVHHLFGAYYVVTTDTFPQ